MCIPSVYVNMHHRWYCLFFVPVLCLFGGSVRAQVSPSAEELFRHARTLAFDSHDYPAAIQRVRAALALSPRDPDIRIFLGRLYSWTRRPDSARVEFDEVLKDHPGYEDGYVAYADLERWNGNDARSLEICSAGLAYHPRSAPLLKRRAMALFGAHNYKEAKSAADSALQVDAGDGETRALAARIRDYSSFNKIGISYDHVYFDRQYDDPWELVSIDYSRQTGIGTVIGRVNYANRFRSNGVQVEVEAYPHISKTFYGYVNLGYSGDVGIFPRYRAGASLYVNLPHAFEADGGVRYLYFGSNTWIYTFSIGKYYKAFWFNARTYLIPGGSNLSQSVTVTGRWYFGGADDYFSLAIGTGISPDDRSNSQQLAAGTSLRSHKAEIGWHQSFGRRNVVFAGVQWLYQEYLPKMHGNQVDISIGYQRRF